jgi:hypothetical protein
MPPSLVVIPSPLGALRHQRNLARCLYGVMSMWGLHTSLKFDSAPFSIRWRSTQQLDFLDLDSRLRYPTTATMFARSALRAVRAHAPTGAHALPRAALTARPYASLSPDAPPPTKPYEVFDETSKTRQRDRAVIRLREGHANGGPAPEVLDYLREDVADRICERVEVRTTTREELTSRTSRCRHP